MIVPFPTREQETEQEVVSSTTTAHARANGRKAAIAAKLVKMSIKITPWVVEQLESWIEQTSLDVLEYAVQETTFAPRPSMRYIQAIVRRCNNEGLLNWETIRAQQKRQTASSTGQHYTQRRYTNNEDALDELMKDWTPDE